ncbi:hypothetical protein N0V88_000357 [Collariella sp. IMI 366227]|nr:hypothetical protein N0V88_000357 [Collariella sp. IMI 366227]
MACSELPATLRFLTDAGHLLATASPETSAYLMSRRGDLMFEHEIPVSDKQRQHICTCCGHIMLLGQASELYIKPEKKMARHANRKEGGQRSLATTLRPNESHQLRTLRESDRAPISRRKVVKVEKPVKGSVSGVSSAVSSTPQETPSQKPSASASSKKRAKSRKAGLQALLNQSSTSKPGLGLSLADFMAR